ncbi:MAG: alpha/beta fold hydrolase [Deltaproteobacteria bacterium]|nr:alpha/beta fold hydrolase [Deltaproteobacteria bacterium]MBN2688298.1 alpha/beta fold hydrolase [Deltaproteobacteria bacterium]
MGWTFPLLMILVMVAIALFVPYLLFDRETIRLDETVRTSLPGNFIALYDGVTNYKLEGSDGGPIVVLIHGFSTPSRIWDYTAPALVDAGYRVLQYDLYGRGYSDRPFVDYDEELFDRQLIELLSALGINSPVDLVGLSMGGAIAVIFAARHPELVRKIVLVDPAGYPVPLPAMGRVVRMPVVGDYLMQVLGNHVIVRDGGESLYHEEKLSELLEIIKAQMVYRGYKRAILSTLRKFDLSDQRWAYETVGKKGLPVLLFWGREDSVIPFENSAMVRNAITGTVFHAIDECGHIGNFERPEIVNPVMIEFLKES